MSREDFFFHELKEIIASNLESEKKKSRITLNNELSIKLFNKSAQQFIDAREDFLMRENQRASCTQLMCNPCAL